MVPESQTVPYIVQCKDAGATDPTFYGHCAFGAFRKGTAAGDDELATVLPCKHNFDYSTMY